MYQKHSQIITILLQVIDNFPQLFYLFFFFLTNIRVTFLIALFSLLYHRNWCHGKWSQNCEPIVPTDLYAGLTILITFDLFRSSFGFWWLRILYQDWVWRLFYFLSDFGQFTFMQLFMFDPFFVLLFHSIPCYSEFFILYSIIWSI